jgi:outer membrane receptor protein involved in Fe transport
MKQVFTLLALLAACYSFSQNAEISGEVTDQSTKEPLVGAAVKYGRGNGTLTDAGGHYKISMPEGQYELVYSSLGFKKDKQSITVKAGEKRIINIVMKTDAFSFNEITTVSLYKKNAAKETVSTEVVTSEQIKHTNSQDLGDALGRTSGVLVQDGQITIRGGSSYSYGVGSRTAVLQDGQSLMSADLGQSQNTMAELENTKQIEVVKGASSVVYGSSALLGVVNVVTDWPSEDTPKTIIDVNSGVYGNTPKKYQIWWNNALPFFTNINVNHRRKVKNVQMMAGGNMTGIQSYLQDNSDWRVQGFFKTRYISPNVEGLNYGVDGSVQYETVDEFFIAKDADTSAFKSGAGSSSRYFRFNIDPHLNYALALGHTYNLKIRYMNIDRLGNGTDPNAVSHQIMVDNQYQYKWKHMLVLTAGAPFTIGDSRSNLYEADHITVAAAGYSQLEFNYKRLTLQGGLRYEVQKVDQDLEKGIPVFRSGLNFEASKTTHLRASWGQGYRIPTIGERDILQNFYPGILVIPNDTLHPERSYSAEIGITQGFRIGRNFIAEVDLAVYYSRYNEFTEYDFGTYINRFPGSGRVITTDTSYLNNVYSVAALADKPNTPLTDLSLFGIRARNIANAQIFGYEFSIRGRGQIGRVTVTATAGYSYNYGSSIGPTSPGDHYSEGDFFKDAFIYNVHRIVNPNTEAYKHLLEYRVRHLFRSDIELKYWKVYVGATLSYESFPEEIPGTILLAVNTIAGNDSYQNYFNTHKGDAIGDVRMGYMVNKHFDVGFIVKNLANRFYMLRPGKPEPIRNYTIQMRYNF